jgi:hypothetical protein
MHLVHHLLHSAPTFLAAREWGASSRACLRWFRENKDVPPFAAGVYTVWHRDGRFIHVGMSGRSITSETVPGPFVLIVIYPAPQRGYLGCRFASAAIDTQGETK